VGDISFHLMDSCGSKQCVRQATPGSQLLSRCGREFVKELSLRQLRERVLTQVLLKAVRKLAL
jgi:hypothetical protein